ncbi:hypothetical protein F3Y22_tig00111772pilonHSYRG00253 [Hibiscus syriacus]|uniref:NB-ARC domain-containing protein n=1 Tax=Hibiscus syriacus TaxID=106335 RepID=A0A6A2YDF3_HIBSY|nr:probable disease resistance protein At5g63020 [Hibiscus syriacus]KAE8673809.1 hypothetical protein F3Y22_tig00111772pilonHSYRG00253 [Hibiscus syriacus]
MQSIVSSAASRVAKYTFGVIKREIGYIIYVASNVQDLKEQVGKLEDARGRVQHSVDRAIRNAEKNEADVLKWLANVNKKLTENVEEKLKEDEEKEKKKCFFALCPNVKSRYQVSKKAVEEAQAISELLEQGKFDKVSYSPAMEGIITKGYKAFELRTKALEGIMEALNESNARIVGIHGMAGVGKTTLAKEVAARVKRSTRSTKLQWLLSLIIQTSEKIKEKLLTFLDDLWQKLDLEEVGISFEDEAAKRSSIAGCKILLTSRSLNVLRLTHAEKSFKVEILSQGESMILFSKTVGDISGNYERIENEFKEKCEGLPVAILAIANTLKDMDLRFWEDALLQLRGSNSSNLEGMQDNVYYTIALSYKWLRNDEAKSLFFICGLHPQSFDIPFFDLLQYCFGLDLLEGTKGNRLKELLRKENLKGCSAISLPHSMDKLKIHLSESQTLFQRHG